MEGSLDHYRKGDVVIVPFPYADSNEMKRRPALVIASPAGRDIILLLITSRPQEGRYQSSITDDDFLQGGLDRTSYVKINRITSIDKNIILKRAGTLTAKKTTEIQDKLIALLSA